MRQCSQCGLLWMERKVLDDTYYDTIDVQKNPEKIERRRRNSLQRLRSIRRHIPLEGLCDIGTGEGTLLQVMQEQGYRDAYGIEPGEEGVAMAAQVGLPVLRGTLSDVPALIAQRPTRVLTLFHVIEHLDDPVTDLQTLFSAMDGGSFLVIETPNKDSYSARALGDAWQLYYPEHLTLFNEQTLPTLLRKVGFTVVVQGRRDFDAPHFSIGESLFRLGLRRPSPVAAKQSAPVSIDALQSVAPVGVRPLLLKRIMRELLRSLLAQAVIRAGRLDYVWIIAQKPPAGTVPPSA